MSEEIVSEYDHDILILISTAQKVRDGEEKSTFINPQMQTRQNRDRKTGLSFIRKNRYVGLISTDFI